MVYPNVYLDDCVGDRDAEGPLLLVRKSKFRASGAWTPVIADRPRLALITNLSNKMNNYTLFVDSLADSDAAEQFLVDTYGMSPFQAWGFVQQVLAKKVNDTELAYTLGALDAHTGQATKITNQLNHG